MWFLCVREKLTFEHYVKIWTKYKKRMEECCWCFLNFLRHFLGKQRSTTSVVVTVPFTSKVDPWRWFCKTNNTDFFPHSFGEQEKENHTKFTLEAGEVFISSLVSSSFWKWTKQKSLCCVPERNKKKIHAQTIFYAVIHFCPWGKKINLMQR